MKHTSHWLRCLSPSSSSLKVSTCDCKGLKMELVCYQMRPCSCLVPHVAVLTCVILSACLVFFQAMKGEKGMPGVAVGESLGEDLTDDSFSK